MTEKEGMITYLVPVEEGMKDEGRNDMRMKEKINAGMIKKEG